jgi:hypothetical protein
MQITTGLKPEWFTPDGSDASYSLAPLDGLQKVEVFHLIERRGDDIVLSPECVRVAIEFCLQDWRGIDGEDGQPLPFSKSLIKFLPHETLTTLAWRCVMGSTLKEDEKKT